jgi:hypothetical protein
VACLSFSFAGRASNRFWWGAPCPPHVLWILYEQIPNSQADGDGEPDLEGLHSAKPQVRQGAVVLVRPVCILH